MYRNIIWDVDGTLFDTYPAFASAFQAGLADLGAEAPLKWINDLAKVSMEHCENTLADHFHLDIDVIDRKFDEHYAQIQYANQLPFPGVKELCMDVCAHGGKNVIVTHRGRAGTVALLETHGMDQFFSDAITRDDGFPRKPAPDAFEATMRNCELVCSETISVGDRDIDVLAGRAAGIFTCLFGSPIEDLSADLTIGDYRELRDYLFGGIC